MKILVVDDYKEGAFITARLLGQYGHEVTTSLDGPSAIKAAAAQKPDVILLDIRMPGMDGFEVCRQIRGLPGMASARIVALTGMEDTGISQQAKEAGFDDVALKASDVDELIKKING